MSWHIEAATAADLAEILALQKLAFAREAARVNEPNIPPMTQTLEDLIAEARVKRVYKVAAPGRTMGPIIGSVRGHLDPAGTCHVGRLCVHPAWQGRGLGTALLRFIERAFPDARRFELFTGAVAADNIALYQRHGYRLIERPAGAPTMLVFLEKPALPAADARSDNRDGASD